MKKFAFTLAEVLITLGIIGVVAAITMPMLIAKHQKMQTVTQLKKGYSIVQQALKRAEVDYGEVVYWDFNITGKAWFEKYLKDYIKYTKTYTSTEYMSMASPKPLNNSSTYIGDLYGASGSIHFTTADGMIISVNKPSGLRIDIGIDVNGFKKPNRVGKDMFRFVYTSAYGLQPYGGNGTLASENYGEYDRETVMGTSSAYACNKSKSGKWCAALIMNDGWEIKDDYPW